MFTSTFRPAPQDPGRVFAREYAMFYPFVSEALGLARTPHVALLCLREDGSKITLVGSDDGLHETLMKNNGDLDALANSESERLENIWDEIYEGWPWEW